MKLVLATRNSGKIRELRRILAAAELPVEVEGLDVHPTAPDVAETEPTFAGNALLKARAVAGHTGLAAVADDSGLCVDALNGMPGVLSARWSGRFGAATGDKNRANLELLLDQLADTPAERRGAHFVCAAALVLPDGIEHVVQGRMDGRILTAPRGTGGFGYDPVFAAAGHEVSTAELPAAEKDAISHRGKAFGALLDLLPDLLRG